ncbi:hypothetical protein AX774_g6587 [Zancudomyces culisetae]|uniref:Uncharacterized protein n=1 Tax=Zancudomyces culisetae TaxID=1213189 RepID=A0A1R1PG69_ZANCU|nr:hypothetical protein AX774_g6587 [Zancudomyces culisetae]|eukprot:OMH79985.1 hypothetical protein AX774_g6587 [Zancudomyces culisetae]
MGLLQQILLNDGYHIADCQFGEISMALARSSLIFFKTHISKFHGGHMYEHFHVYHVVRKACWTAAFGSLYQLPYTGIWLFLEKRIGLCRVDLIVTERVLLN